MNRSEEFALRSIRGATETPGDRLELTFVFAVWVLMSAGGLAFISYYGSDIPVADDWGFVISFAEGQPLTASWLWEQVAEHRLPLQKLVMWCVWHATGGSLRSGMLCGFIPLALIAGFLPLAARSARERSEYTDAFLPLLLLHLGHAGMFTWFTTMSVPWTAAVVCLLLALFANPQWCQTTWGAVVCGLILILLPLLGATGVTASLPFALGLLLMAIVAWWGQNSIARRRALVLTASVVVTGIIAAAVVLGFDRTGLQDPGGGSIAAIGSVALEFLTMSFGQTARRLWPLSGIGVLALIVATILLLLHEARRAERQERFRAILLVLAILAPCVTAVAVGIGRQMQGALVNRYGLYSAPLLCAIYFAWVLHGPPRSRQFVQMVLFTLMCASSLYYVSEALREGKARRGNTEAFMADLVAGKPLSQLVAKHDPMWVGDEKRFRRGLLALRQAGIVPFDSIRDDPALEELHVTSSPSAAHEMIAANGVWRGTGRDSRLVFSFEQPAHVVAVRCAYVLKSRRNSTLWETSWIRSTTDDPFRQAHKQETLVNFNSARPRGEEVQTAWIDEPIRAFAISPCAEACEFQIVGLTLLLRAGGSPPAIRRNTVIEKGESSKSSHKPAEAP